MGFPDIKSFQQKSELPLIYFPRFTAIFRPGERILFQARLPETETVIFPVENL
jgi:hypothetical protein